MNSKNTLNHKSDNKKSNQSISQKKKINTYYYHRRFIYFQKKKSSQKKDQFHIHSTNTLKTIFRNYTQKIQPQLQPQQEKTEAKE